MAWTIVALMLARSICGQTPAAQVQFDAASIKESKSLAGGGSLRFVPGGGITAQHIPARAFVTVAYGLQPFQLVGAPDWTRETYFDLVAKPASAATREGR